jgi:outer membrane autotransporter protein
MGDAGTSSIDVAALGSSVTSTDYGMGVYGGTNWGDTELRFAAAYSRHDNSSSRSVVYPGYTDELSAEYASNTAQVAGEVSHEFALGPVGVTPFARAAYISHATDGFSETGGAAALTYVDDVAVATIATIGASVEYQMVVGDDMLLTASASLGWRHASAGDLYVDLALEGGTPVAIAGIGMTDTTALGAGLYLDVSDTAAFEVTYAGQIGSNAQTHALSGTWAAKF